MDEVEVPEIELLENSKSTPRKIVFSKSFSKNIGEDRHLSQEEEEFCVLFVKTGNIRESYKQATRKYRPGEIKVQPYRWMNSPKIINRIRELYQSVRKSTEFSLSQHLDKLAELRDQAQEAGEFSSAIVAEVARGRAAGFYVTRKELKVTGDLQQLTTSEIEARLKALEEHDDKLIELEGQEVRNGGTPEGASSQKTGDEFDGEIRRIRDGRTTGEASPDMGSGTRSSSEREDEETDN